jgi:anthranilate phosphoribosyltransferase
MDIKTAIRQLMQQQDIDTVQMAELMREIMSGQCTDAQIAAFLVALQIKGVSSAELLGAARVMRELVLPVVVSATPHLIDTCGTGGSGTDTFNISTASALVAACAGAQVAKHGNRGASSKSGSADVLEAAGVNLAVSPQQVARCIDTIGVGFMFARSHHSAMKHVGGPRGEIGVRTIFNLLGPLTNPASAPNQVLGVYDPALIDLMLPVLKELGSRHVLMVCSEEGLDEISLSAPTRIGELKEGQISFYTVRPADFAIEQRDGFAMLQVNSPAESLALLKQALDYSNRAAGDIVALNAGAAIYTADLAVDLAAGVSRAQEILHSGAALLKLQQLVNFTSALDQ